jgi:hypothetical protein
VWQGLTLDIAGGNLLRLGKDGVILAASHGTRWQQDGYIIGSTLNKNAPPLGIPLVWPLSGILYFRKMNDIEIERQYGRNRNKHITSEYATHLEVAFSFHLEIMFRLLRSTGPSAWASSD